MKPFNLERAFAGEPIISRDGRSAYLLARVEGARDGHQLAVVIDGEVQGYWPDGMYMSDQSSSFDLFMAPKKRTVYVNLWAGKPPRGSIYSENGQPPEGARVAHHFDTEEEAINAAFDCVTRGKSPHCIAQAVPIEIEE